MKRLLLILLIALCLMPTLAQTSADDCNAGFRLVEHTLGATCVPETPARIVPLDMTIVELLLIAGVEPVVTSTLVLNTYARMHPDLEETYTALMENTPDMGFPPNIEVILDAEPDLIIGFRDFLSEGLYDDINEIVPTVLLEPAPGNWRERLIFAGDVLGMTDTVDELLADYDARVEELRTLLGEDADEIEISLVRALPGQIGLVLEGTAAAGVLREVGLGRPEGQEVDYDYVLDALDGRPELLISEEELRLADGDIVFVFGDSSELFDLPLWNALPAVADERAYEVGYYWWGDSLISAHAMLDDLFMYVADAEPEHPNPFRPDADD
ncbi:MAG: iron-siderophore ABC transporter substrate-binding protein [Anaerolineae bacterium]